MNFLENVARLAEAVPPVANAKVAAVVVYKRRIVAYGMNEKRSHPFQKKFSENEHKIFLHAEVAAILNAKRYLTDGQLAKSTLYVARVKHPDNDPKAWTPGLAKPCPGCQECIEVHNIQNVVYTE